MSIAILQEAALVSTTSTNVPSFSVLLGSNVTPGSSLYVIGMCTNATALATPTDTGGDNFSLIGNVVDSTDNRHIFHWYANNAIGGATTVTIPFNGPQDHQWFIQVREIGSSAGNDASATGPVSGGQLQASGSYTAGTDCWTTGATKFAPSNAPGLAVGFCITPVSGPPTAVGTGFTVGQGPVGLGGNFGGQYTTESKRYTVTTAFAVTFTDNGANTNSAITLGALFLESQNPMIASTFFVLP